MTALEFGIGQFVRYRLGTKKGRVISSGNGKYRIKWSDGSTSWEYPTDLIALEKRS